MTNRDAYLLIIGLAVGALLSGLACLWRRRSARARAEKGKLNIVKLGHDIRGAVTPALLMTERLETHPDQAVRQAAEVIGKAMERIADMTKSASAEVRGVARDKRTDA